MISDPAICGVSSWRDQHLHAHLFRLPVAVHLLRAGADMQNIPQFLDMARSTRPRSTSAWCRGTSRLTMTGRCRR